jgi:hypothetical protein
MSTGVALGIACYPDAAAAASALCAQTYGVSDEGVISCAGYSVSGNTVNWDMRVTRESGSSISQQTYQFYECERFDWGFWTPVWAALALALVGLACMKHIRNIFDRQAL